MRELLTSAGLAAGLAIWAAGAQAATLGLETIDPRLQAGDATVFSIDLLNGEKDFSLEGVIDAATGTTVPTGSDVVLGFSYLAGDPTAIVPGSGAFQVDDGSAFRLLGDVVAIGWVADVIEVRLEVTGGLEAGGFRHGALALIDFGPGFGAAPFAALQDLTEYDVSVSIAALPVIPLPAGALVLLSALGAVGGLAMRRPS